MNKREIDEMMRDLPSQKPVETLAAKIGIVILFMGVFYAMAMLPNMRRAQDDQKESYCRESSRRANLQDAERSIGMDRTSR
jgi:hypothetical protein